MTNQEPTYKEKLTNLRKKMQGIGVDGFIVPRADEYQGEFLAAYAERLPWLTGFTGSGGCAVILKERAVVLTDGRYTIQVVQQVDKALYDTGDITKDTVAKWLAQACGQGDVIGYDPMLHTPKQIDAIEKECAGQGVKTRAIENLVDQIWENQAPKPDSVVRVFPEELAGVSSETKRENIAKEMQQAGIFASVLTLPDSIAWLLNIRGQDVEYIPLILSYAIIDNKGHVHWFVETGRVSDRVRAHMGANVTIIDPAAIAQHIEKLAAAANEAGQSIGVDYMRSPIWFKAQVEEASGQVVDYKDPCILPKSLKSDAEQAAIRAAHIVDGVALVRFLHWLDEEAPKGHVTELDIDTKLHELRAQQETFRGLSFPVIAGFGANGAIVHYRATKDSYAKIEAPGLLLVDSGGQYIGGTTDVTRTMVIGDVTDEARDNFTRVLKGHIAIASAEVPVGTLGVDIDALARAPLQAAGLNYAHGTGHGVGCYLAVHEEAAGFSPRGKDEVQARMLISNEPGYYKEGAYGIRIESLVIVKDVGDEKLGFETVTMAPVDRRAINADMMEPHEIKWLDTYHELVWKKLSGIVTGDVKRWLREQTQAL